MARLLVAFAAVLLVATGCSTAGNQPVNPFRPPVTGVPFTQECTAKAANGDCLKYTCKADAAANCDGFANGCVSGGNYYAGSSEGGSCSRVL